MRHMPLHDNSVAAALAAEAAAAGGAAFAAAPVASAQSSDFGQIGQMVEQMGAQHGIDAEQVRQYASQVPGLDQLGFGSLELPASLGDAHKPTNGTITSNFGTHLHLGGQNPAGQWIDSVTWLAANGVIV
ncbi:MAG: hypothetical protein QME79_12660 [Bacillota bacterium]|nr:hypothetical protein [Bacillota bacterium]